MLSLADAILQEDLSAITQLLNYGEEVNQIDIYGFTPLIEAAITDSVEISKILLEHGADPNQQDVTGGTPLQWAVENNNTTLCQLLLQHRANPNAYNLSGQPVLTMPILRHQSSIKQLLIDAGADLVFAQDYINTKLLGHIFELTGTANIIDPQNKFVEVDFEGFYLEVTLGLIAHSLAQFQNHFAARQLRRFSSITHMIIENIQRAAHLIKYQQYRVDTAKCETEINYLLHQEPLIIPVGYEGHAITFIKYDDIWIKCDRREDSRLYDNIMYYRVTHPEALTSDFIKHLIYVKQSSSFINNELDIILGLEPLTELKVEAQVSGNCSWANVEATIPALFFLTLMHYNQQSEALPYYKTLALNFYHRWQDWNKEKNLHLCIQSYLEGDAVRKACKAEILGAILFQRLNPNKPTDRVHITTILELFKQSPYKYILKNYLKIYYQETYTEEGKHFADLLKDYGLLN